MLTTKQLVTAAVTAFFLLAILAGWLLGGCDHQWLTGPGGTWS